MKQRLDMVSNVDYSIDDKYVSVQFDGVSNASGYIVSIDVGIGISRRIERAEVVKFDTDNMTDGKNYTISITSVGEGDYTDSDVYKLSFTYNRPEETYTFIKGQFMTEADLLNYLYSLGVSEDHITAHMDEENYCDGNAQVVSTSLDNREISRSELLSSQIEYTVCRMAEDEKE